MVILQSSKSRRPMSEEGLGRVKTKSDLVVVSSGGQIFAFFCSPLDHRAQNSGCGYTAQSFHTARGHLRKLPRRNVGVRFSSISRHDIPAFWPCSSNDWLSRTRSGARTTRSITSRQPASRKSPMQLGVGPRRGSMVPMAATRLRRPARAGQARHPFGLGITGGGSP
jgi:hypothetical protein